jgi:hypothetical protein
VLTAVLGPLGGIAAAAFGIKQSTDAKAETKRVKKDAGRAAEKLAGRPGGRAAHQVRDGGEAGDDTTVAEVEADLRRLAE